MKRSLHFSSTLFSLAILFCAVIVACTQEETKKDINEKSTKESISVAPKTVPESKSPLSKTEVPGAKEDAVKVPETVKYPSEIVLLSSLWKKHSKGPVRLTHKKHFKNYGVSCNECHHIFQKSKNIWQPVMPVDKCETCHNDPTIKGEAGWTYGQFREEYKDGFDLNPEGLQALKAASRNKRVFVLSNTSYLHALWLFEQEELATIPEQYVFSFKIGAMKPDAAIWEALLRAGSLEARRCLYVDDIAEYCRAAAQTGFATIHYRMGETDLLEELSKWR